MELPLQRTISILNDTITNINLTSPEAIQRLANNHAIAVNLRDGFPYPYTIEDAITVCYVNFQN